MKYYYFLVLGAVLVLAGCGQKVAMNTVQFDYISFDVPQTYVVSTDDTTSIMYVLDGVQEQSVIQMSSSSVSSGVDVEQMSSLHIQKLEVSLPGYSFVDKSMLRHTCRGRWDGVAVNFITISGGKKLYHTQYHTIMNGVGYIWSVTSTVDHTRKVMNDILASVQC